MPIENPHGINIDMDQFTTNVVKQTDNTVTGDGIFDILMTTATKHIEAQFDGGRIRGEDFATTYMQVYQATLGAALQIWLQKPITELQRESEAAKRDLYYRQIQGFDEDFKQKILKIELDAWAVGFSVSRDAFEAAGIPGPMQKQTIDDMYNNYIGGNFETYNYGRSPESVNRGVEMDLEEVIKNTKTVLSKLTAVNANVADSAKTTAQKAYNTTVTTNVEQQVANDVANIPEPTVPTP